MDIKQLIVHALQVAIIATVFGFGLRATLDDVLYVLRRPGLLIRSFLAVLVVMPMLVVVFVKGFDLRTTIEVVLVALALSPVPPLLPRKEKKAGGLPSFGLGLMLVLAVGAIPAYRFPLRCLITSSNGRSRCSRAPSRASLRQPCSCRCSSA